MLEPWAVAVGSVMLAGPVAWAGVIGCWWAVADIREKWRSIMASAAEHHHAEYEAPSTPPSRPSLELYLRAVTATLVCAPLLALVCGFTGSGLAAGLATSATLTAVRELREQLAQLRARAAEQIRAA